MNQCTIMSFGFKYGRPPANYYFDVGFAKNPARENNWDFFSIPNSNMRKFILDQAKVEQFIDLVVPLIDYLVSLDQHQVIAFGCNSGRHRSHIIAEEIARRLMEWKGIEINVIHRDA